MKTPEYGSGNHYFVVFCSSEFSLSMRRMIFYIATYFHGVFFKIFPLAPLHLVFFFSFIKPQSISGNISLLFYNHVCKCNSCQQLIIVEYRQKYFSLNATCEAFCFYFFLTRRTRKAYSKSNPWLIPVFIKQNGY